MIRSISFLLLILLSMSAAAQTDSLAVPAKKVRKIGVLPVPTIGFAPETRLYFGAVALFTLRFWQDDSLTRLSSAKAEVSYTLNKQLITEVGWNLFTRKNKLAFDGLVGFRKFPENYWGIGAAMPKTAVERVDMTRLEVEARGLRSIRNNMYLGMRLKMQNVFKVVPDSGGSIETLQPPGYDGGFSMGIGPAFSLDTRDNPLNPKKGIYLSLSSLGFGRFVGSEFGFTRTEVDLRKYLRPFPRHVLAVQCYTLLQTGTPPLRLLGLVGSDREMRGYYQGRYRDQNLLAFQAEYRMPLFWRFGLTAFVGAGEVWNWNNPYQMEVFKFTTGGGLRFLMDKKDNVNLRLDFAVGNGTTGFYVAFGEAF
ncbi:MAG: BamA/TamA family outer membrane protein [Bacteroidetes bacterium]|nr:BamA/TamA family outer membrane protein [Bacteroidota bacterium]